MNAATTGQDLDLGAATDDVEVHEAKRRNRVYATITVTRHEHGWKIDGRHEDAMPHQHFEAEIGDCDRCTVRPEDLRRYSGRPRPGWRGICTTLHAYGTDTTTNHFRDYCHEFGHIERVRALAEKIVGSY